MNFDVTQYNPSKEGFSENFLASYPIGGGDCGANVFLSADGTLHLLLSKTDSFAESGRLMKLGYLKIRYETPVFSADNPPVLTLHLENGTIVVRDTRGEAELTVAAFVDRPLYGIRSRTAHPNRLTAVQEQYRDEVRVLDPKDESAYSLQNAPFTVRESADIVTNPENTLAWCHHNQWSYYLCSVMNQHLSGVMRTDPILYRTFGCAAAGDRFVREGTLLRGPESLESVLYVSAACRTALDGDIFNIEESHALTAALPRYRFDALLEENRRWWTRYFTEYYVHVYGTEEAEDVTRGYTLQKYLLGCAGRGSVPIEFNGSLFTMHPSPYYEKTDYDYRRWGEPFWIQNTRLMYWDMLYSGDFEGVMHFFDFLLTVVPEAKEHARVRFGCGGLNLPETFTFYGTFADSNYGWGKELQNPPEMVNTYIRWHHNGQLELSYMMLKFRELSGGMYDSYFYDRLLPFIQDAIRFFGEHYPLMNGKLHLYPVSSLETWQNCIDDTPDIAGLHAVCRALRRIGVEPCIDESTLPDIPVMQRNGKTVLAPCASCVDAAPRNIETPELYPLFPFECYTFRMDDDTQEMLRETFRSAPQQFCNGWSQRSEWAAMLGLADECGEILVKNFRSTCPDCAFPGFFGPNFDWTPDQCHGSSTSLGLLFMLLQTYEGENACFRALPKGWKADFRLPSCKGTAEASSEA